MKICKNLGVFAGLFGLTIIFMGCAPEKPAASTSDSKTSSTTEVNKHSGWWCTEHGIPETECSMCSAKFAAECKAKGDWCAEHNRAESQCFICDPSRAQKYAKLYEAKYGKSPPAITQ